MPDINTIFDSKYLRAADLKGQPRTVVITGAEAGVIGQGEKAAPKLILRLATPQGRPIGKAFVAGKVNAVRLGSDLGTTKYDQWLGRAIVLKQEFTLFQGQMVPCIRAYGAGSAAPAAAIAPPQPAPVAPPAAAPFPSEAGALEDINW